jgi:hypothetical protein
MMAAEPCVRRLSFCEYVLSAFNFAQLWSLGVNISLRCGLDIVYIFGCCICFLFFVMMSSLLLIFSLNDYHMSSLLRTSFGIVVRAFAIGVIWINA